MDGQQFDALAKRWATGRASRRSMLKGAVASLVAGVVGSTRQPAATSAAPGICDQRSYQDCRKDARARFKMCVDNCNAAFCRGADRDPDLCAGCQTNCLLIRHNDDGQCEDGGGCPDGQACCGDACVDLTTSPANCGACGDACAAHEVCTGGSCDCAPGFGDCGDGICRDPMTDQHFCGCFTDCGDCYICHNGECSASLSCPDGQVQDNISCECICPSDTVECDGQCVHPSCDGGQQFDPTTCACICPPDQCPEGQTQNPETCQCEGCSPGQEACGEACYDACPAGQPRNPTTCVCDCPSGFTRSTSGKCCDSRYVQVCGEQICCLGEECLGDICCPGGKSCPGAGVVNGGGRACCAADQQCCCSQVDEGVHQQYGTGGCVAFQCEATDHVCGGRIGSGCHPESVYNCCCGLVCRGYQAGDPNRRGTCQIA